jgi:hypothetical protein
MADCGAYGKSGSPVTFFRPPHQITTPPRFGLLSPVLRMSSTMRFELSGEVIWQTLVFAGYL